MGWEDKTSLTSRVLDHAPQERPGLMGLITCSGHNQHTNDADSDFDDGDATDGSQCHLLPLGQVDFMM